MSNWNLEAAAGVPGTSVLWRGVWSASLSYNIKDGVLASNGCSYVSQTNNQGQEPSVSPSDWSMIASKGDHGSNAYTLTVADFVTPPVGGMVVVNLADTAWIVVGQMVVVETAGGSDTAAYSYRVRAKTTTNVTLENTGVSGQVFPFATLGDMTMAVYDTNGDGIVDVAASANAVTYANVSGKPTTFAPSTHAASHIDNGTDAIPVATSSRTGLAPKLSGTATTFLNGAGAFTTPTGSGDMLKSVYDANADNIVDVAATANAVAYVNVSGKPATFPATAHASTHNLGGSDVIAPDYSQIANKPSTFAPDATAELVARKGAASGYAGLDGTTKVPLAQLPSPSAGVNATTVQLVKGDDTRLSDARTPLAHANSHLDNGSDPIAVVTSTRTGLAPKLSGTATTFLNGTGAFTTPSGAGDMTKAVYDTNADNIVDHAALADAAPWTGITSKPSTFAPSAHASTHLDNGTDAIAVVTSTRTGLAPKLSGTATTYLDGTGAFSTPAGGGSSPMTTTVTVAFTMPNWGGTVSVTVGDTSWMQSGMLITIGIGAPTEYVIINSITDSTHFVLLNYTGPTNSGTIAIGALVRFTGLGQCSATSPGLVPAPPNDATKVLRGDGLFGGRPALTVLTASFTCPAFFASVAGVTIVSAPWISIGDKLMIYGIGKFVVSGKASNTSITLFNTGDAGNASSGTVASGLEILEVAPDYGETAIYVYQDHFLTGSDGSYTNWTVAGTGATKGQSSAVDHPGVYFLTTGTSSGTAAAGYAFITANNAYAYGTGALAFRGLYFSSVKPTSVAAALAKFYLGLGTQPSNGTYPGADFVGFVFDPSSGMTNAANNWGFLTRKASVSTYTDTGYAYNTASYSDLSFYLDSNGATFRAYNWAGTAQAKSSLLTTNVPLSSTNLCLVFFAANGASGTTSYSTSIDLWETAYRGNTVVPIFRGSNLLKSF